MEDIKYPIGKVVYLPFTQENKKAFIQAIKTAPTNIEMAVQHLDKAQLETPYREGGWTIQQVMHHLADSHMNAFIRFKLALTEEVPAIKAYNEAAFANTTDSLNAPVNYSTTILHALHARWVILLESMTDEDFQKKLFHPVRNAEVSLWDMLAIYAWHGKHHLKHITNLCQQKGW